MDAYISEDFLLTSKLARRLFHDVASALPIVDYHSHLDPRDLAEDRRFENLTQLWITGDPYKHRAMRITGIPEAEITGPADDRSKFDHWAATVPQTIGNPLFEWNALELKRYFGIDEILSPATAPNIWDGANSRLREPAYSARGLMRRYHVTLAVTSDRLLDSLEHHQSLRAESDEKPELRPSLRADDIIAFSSPDYIDWIEQLGAATEENAATWAGFKRAIDKRLDVFAESGCTIADYGLADTRFAACGEDETATLFERGARREILDESELLKLRSGVLVHLGTEYAKRDWVMLLHIGAHRQTSTRLRKLAGPNGGHACPASPLDIAGLCALLDATEQRAGRLPRTIIFPLNPVDYPAVATMTGSFAADGVRGLVQLGPAWWYNDQAGGIEAHLEALSSYGLLSTFVGMTTDSRSLLSTARHEYFRRLLCSWIARKVKAGHLPEDFELLAPLVRATCHENAAAIFNP